jgi:ribosomal protein S18 acetylase RimI-like enzyme
MGLLPDYRGKGLGRRLLDECLDLAASGRVLTRIELEVRVDNERAARAYRAAGFQIEGRKLRRMQVDGQYFDTFVMAKLLHP